MSYSSITAATRDAALLDRVTAAAGKEAWQNVELAATPTGATIRNNPTAAVALFAWPVAIDHEAAYESALVAGNPDPGGDPAVITDAALLSSVQAHWPPVDVIPPPP